MFISKFVLLIVGLSCISYSIQESQLKTVVYYEGLCGCSRGFITDQLYPAYQKLGDSILVELVPFGNAIGAKTDDGWEWDCQHGPLECYINKVEACIISLKPPQSQLLSSVNCIAKQTSKDKTADETEAIAKQCAEDNKLSWDDVNKCITDGTADTLLFGYQERQSKLQPPLPFVPNIRFNDVFDLHLDNAAREDFLKTACGLLNGTKPSACDGEFKIVKNLNKPKTC